jgi:hypothetical protein
MELRRQTRVDLGFFKTTSFWLTIESSLTVPSFYYLSRPEIRCLTRINILEIIEAKTLEVRFLLDSFSGMIVLFCSMQVFVSTFLVR